MVDFDEDLIAGVYDRLQPADFVQALFQRRNQFGKVVTGSSDDGDNTTVFHCYPLLSTVRHKSHTRTTIYYMITLSEVEEWKMPIFEYQCEKCGEQFEYFHWADEDEESLKCPKCGSIEKKRVISSFSNRDGSCAPRQSG